MQIQDLEEVTIRDLQRLMQSGETTAVEIASLYLERIEGLDRHGPQLRSVMEVNPEALEIAEQLDLERARSGPRGPLHGIPVLLKDNIDTADQMMTTAGSLALLNWHPAEDAFVATRLRQAGAVLLGKTNMSEWANFRSSHSSSGWSGRGGQALNPYALDRSPCGSSSGSATAVAANLAAASLGSETDGSIVCPASVSCVVGIKPTVGLTSRAGVIPISHSQDGVGPFGRTVEDAALVLAAITGIDARDPATSTSAGRYPADYTLALDPDGLRGARIGIPREVYFGYSEKTDAVVNQAIEIMKELGAVIVDPANIPTAKQLDSGNSEMEILLYEFKADLNAYLKQVGPEVAVHSLQDVITFNETHAEQEMPYFRQELLEMAQAKGPLTESDYLEALETSRTLSREKGIDAVLREFQLDALMAPTGGPAWKIDLIDGDHHMGASSQPAAMAGYPAVSVPAGFTFGLPIGLTFFGSAYSEPALIRLAHAFEKASKVRRPPRYLPQAEGDPIA